MPPRRSLVDPSRRARGAPLAARFATVMAAKLAGIGITLAGGHPVVAALGDGRRGAERVRSSATATERGQQPADLRHPQRQESARGSYLRLVQGREADQRAGQPHKPEQNVGAPLVADLKPPAAQQPRQRPLHHIAVPGQLVAGLDPAPGDPGRDPPPAQRPTAAWVVVPLSPWSLAGRPRGRPGQPRGPLTGGTASTICSSSIESWVSAADSPTASGVAPRSTSRWYLEPGLPRSVGLGPVIAPPVGRGPARIPAVAMIASVAW
jgi:hypothetical protein